MKRYFIDSKNYVFENIMVMGYTPKTLKSHIKSRITSTFLYVINGNYSYAMKNETFDVGSGEFAYIPKGAEYVYNITGEDVRAIQVEFDLYSTENGEKTLVTFSNKPIKLPYVKEAKDLLEDMLGENLGNTYMTLSILYRLLSLFFDNAYNMSVKDANRRKIIPASEYINKNMRFNVSVDELAEMCGLSTPHFRRLFRSLTGKSPIKYKNQVLMKSACKILKSETMNVSEIADFLGFTDVYTFSQTFKNEIGVSPTKYV